MFPLIAQLRLTWRLIRDPRVAWHLKLIPLAAVIYVLSPFDIIPDFLIGIGQLDDIGIVWLAMQALERASPVDIVAEHREVLSGKRQDGDRITVTDYKIKRK